MAKASGQLFALRPEGRESSSGSSAKLSLAHGLLPGGAIAQLAQEGVISAARALAADQFQPASLDLRLGRRAWRLRAGFLPGPSAQVETRVKEFALHTFNLDEAAVFEKGCIYLAELEEAVSLPANISALANPKSSTGRVDVFARLLRDYATAFNTAPAGYRGKLYLEITPQSFGVIARRGTRLAQLRLRRGRPADDNYRLAALHRQTPLVVLDEYAAHGRWHGEVFPKLDKGLVVSVDLSGGQGRELAAFKARPYTPLIDLDKIGHYDRADFWEAIPPPSCGYLILEPAGFYLLASREAVRIRPDHAADMLAFDSRFGEFRPHYAGFFDPGFGYGSRSGAKAVLEVRAHDAPFIIEHGQPAARLVFERLAGEAARNYDEREDASYRGQGLALSKHFRGV